MQSYLDNADKTRNDITTAYEAEDYTNYTIYVHALKSTSKMVGALTLSEKARLLEMAGKESNIDYIKESHDEVMELFELAIAEIKDYLEKVKPEEEEAEEVVVADASEIAEAAVAKEAAATEAENAESDAENATEE